MDKRPHEVTVIGCIFIAVGVIGFTYHVRELSRAINLDTALVCFVRLLAIIGGVFMLRGNNWARWLLFIWMVYHIILSAFHSIRELLMHCVIFGIIIYLLIRRRASAYFQTEGLRCGSHEAAQAPQK